MKPERDVQPNMEDKEWDPRELFVTIGMLIVEARLPELSAKGRIEGPHCPQYPNEDTHICDDRDIRCSEAKKFKTYMETLWKNSIPMCIELLLFPKCKHNNQQADVMFIDSSTDCGGEEILLERWDVHMFPKRWAEKSENFVTGRFLIQAMRSYLFFSQLSSWLNYTGGVLPLTVAYRLYAPGESAPHTFQGASNVHHFPAANLSHSTVKVCVTASHRMQNIPILLCQRPMDNAMLLQSAKMSDQIHKSKNLPKSSQENYETGRRKKTSMITSTTSTTAACDNNYKNSDAKKLNPRSLSATTTTSQLTAASGIQKILMHSKSKCSSVHMKDCVQTITAPSCSVSQAVFCNKVLTQQKNMSFSSMHSRLEAEEDSLKLASKFAKLEVKSNSTYTYPTASRNIFSEKPLVFHTEDDATYSQKVENKVQLLHSPKVLLTNCNSTEQAYYSKQKRSNHCTTDKWSLKNEWYPELLCQPGIHELSKPLTSDQIEAYLASLPAWGTSLPKVRRTCLENIPVTKCKFQIGDKTSEKDGEGPCTSSSTILIPKKFPSSHVSHTPKNTTDSTCSASSPKRRAFAENQDDIKCVRQHSNEDFNRNTDKSSRLKRSAAIRLDFSQDVNENLTTTENVCVSGCHAYQHCNRTDCNNKFFSNSSSIDSTAHSNGVDCRKSLATTTIEKKTDIATASTSTTTIGGSFGESRESSCSSSYENEVNGDASKYQDESELVQPTVAKKDSLTSTSCQGKRSLYANSHALKKDSVPVVEKKCIKKDVPSMEDITNFQKNLNKSTSMVFNASTGLPTQSSPAPVKKISGRFDYDSSLTSTKAIKNALSCSKLVIKSNSCDEIDNKENSQKTFSTSAPASTNCLLGNFEESILNGRIEPSGVVEGFMAEIGASGTFCPKHICLPVTSYFFSLSDDNAPSPYLGHINLEFYSKKGYHVPKVGTVQVTLFNPNKTVVKMFVVMYDLQDMPSNSQTFMRQRTMYMPADSTSEEPSYLRYLIHLRISSSKSGNLYLHTDVRLIFSRDKFEYDARVANYELRSFTEGPRNPRFSPKR